MKKIIYIIMLLLCFNLINADHVINIPNYFDVNISEQILLTSPNVTNEIATLFLEDTFTDFSKTSDNSSHVLYILNDVEADLPYVINVFSVGVNRKNFTNGDDSRESFVLIDDSTLYGIRWNHTGVNHTNGTVENDQLCPFVSLVTGSPTFLIWAYVIRDNGSFNYMEGTSHTITNTDYQYLCEETQLTFDQNYTSPFFKYFGLKCINCDASNKFKLGIDTDGNVTSLSFNRINLTEPMVNITDNYMGKAFLVESTNFETYEGIFKFRIPFYLTFNLFSDRNTTFKTNFDYIYLKNIVSSSGFNDTNYADLGTSFSNILTFGLWGGNSIDTTEVFWGIVEDNIATIKLYEFDNYSVNLLSMKTFSPTAWVHEFYKPQYTSSRIETKLDSKLIVDNEINNSFNIMLSEYEVNKFGFYVNIFKWAIVLIVILGGIVISIFSGYPFQSFGAMIVLVTLLIKLLGLA